MQECAMPYGKGGKRLADQVAKLHGRVRRDDAQRVPGIGVDRTQKTILKLSPGELTE